MIRLGVGLAVLAMVVAVLRPVIFPPSLDERASAAVHLPPETRVTKIDGPVNSRSADIWFSAPEPMGAGTRVNDIWLKLGYTLPAKIPATVKLPLIRSPKTARGARSMGRRPLGSVSSSHSMVSPPGAGPVATIAPTSTYGVTVEVKGGLTLTYGPDHVASLTYDAGKGWYHFTRRMP
jgi:hypothetical protein